MSARPRGFLLIPALAFACYSGPEDGLTGDTEAGSSQASSTLSETSSGPGGSTTGSSSDSDASQTSTATTDDAETDPTESTGSTDPTGKPTTDPTDPTTEDPTTEDPTTEDPTTEDPTTEDPTTEDPTTGSDMCTDGTPGNATGDPDDRLDPVAVCTRWSNDRMDAAYGPWCGDVATCDPGDIAVAGRDNTLRLINLYRWLGELPPVTNDPVRDLKAQACALMMQANGQLSHNPPMNWDCYSADGAQAAGSSNIASTSGYAAVDLYMQDPGNPTTIGHRRWILSNSLGNVGLGSASSASCMWVIGGGGNAGKQWLAWPPPGYNPVQVASMVNSTGWTVQSDSINLGQAQVSVTENGQDRPMSVTNLAGGYGSSYAISMIPQGWQAQADTTYEVSITGVNPEINYEVSLLSCN